MISAPAGIAAFTLRESASVACRLLRTLANEDRFLILCQLTLGERNVSDLEASLGMSQSSLSQQLAVLRDESLVSARRSGKFVHYSLAGPDVTRIMSMLSGMYCQRTSGLSISDHDRNVSTAGQLAVDDLEWVASLGFGTVICVRPDSTVTPPDPNSRRIRRAAYTAGLAFHYFPVPSGPVPSDRARRFARLIAQCDGRVLAYCRSGNSSANLYRMAAHLDGTTAAT